MKSSSVPHVAKKKLDGPPLTVRLTAEAVAAIASIAADEDRDVSEIHRKLIREALVARGARLGGDPSPVPAAPHPSKSVITAEPQRR